ncbi:MAG: nucleotidyl transferase AbiEii/AbiGii toxin family protein [Elusimicrobia bacterium]|nr:nucleotidyl transferase AbiEii/AbiGii toxin family protein [Elusimicrobiota bacterium]
MIPKAHITAWRSFAPWASDAQVEQDLVISRAIMEIYSEPFLRERLAFRGGTAIQKLFLNIPVRYSEDIDLVQIQGEPIGKVLNEIRRKLDRWLGNPKWGKSKGNNTLIYKFDSEIAPIEPLRLKVEINTREHFTVLGFIQKSFTLENPWYRGTVSLQTYELEELMGTKLRALYQRKKGRDLFDLDHLLNQFPELNCQKLIECFMKYLEYEGLRITRAQFESNMFEKMRSAVFRADLSSLLRTDVEFDFEIAYKHIHDSLIAKLHGDSWKGIKIKNGGKSIPKDID